MLQTIRSAVYRIQDSFLIRVKSLSSSLSGQHKSMAKSDSQNTPYETSLYQIISSESKLYRFRRIHDYRVIVETVSFNLGLEYLNRINSLGAFEKRLQVLAELNDSFGLPRKFKFENFGSFSPTTLRYISVALEVQKLFPSLDQARIAEVGVGYGGQAAILLDHLRVNRYDLFDLPPALTLSKEYLSRLGKLDGVQFSNLDTLENTNWDLAISNYAFSELPKDLQIKYIQKVFQKSKRGYLIMNSGLTNITGRNLGKLSIHEIRELMPEIQILSEVPNTGPDNYLVVWGLENSLNME